MPQYLWSREVDSTYTDNEIKVNKITNKHTKIKVIDVNTKEQLLVCFKSIMIK